MPFLTFAPLHTMWIFRPKGSWSGEPFGHSFVPD